MEGLHLDLDDARYLLVQAKRENVRNYLQDYVNKLEKTISDKKLTSNGRDSEATAVHSDTKGQLRTQTLSSYAWDQSDKFVKVYVTLKSSTPVSQDQLKLTVEENCFDVKIENCDSKHYKFGLKGLYQKIDVEGSYAKPKSDSILVMLKKQVVGQKWEFLTKSLEAVKHVEEASKPKLDTKSNSNDPSAGLMDMMKQMYETGDDDMKRMIAKSWTESREKQMKGGGNYGEDVVTDFGGLGGL